VLIINLKDIKFAIYGSELSEASKLE